MNRYLPLKLIHTFIFIFFILLYYSFESRSQSKVHGIITEKNGKQIFGANVLLLKSRDSLLVQGAFTDREGKYVFQHIDSGEYTITASFIGFETSSTASFNFSVGENKAVDNIKLQAISMQLDKVTVQAKKPPFEQKIDRLIVNVQSSLTSTGSSVLDVLEKSPGIVLDRQNSALSMAGKEGVVIMINGKINNMPASAMLQMLAGMPAANVEKIELITTPPATLDAEGNAGFINIVLKTNPEFGTTGLSSLTLGYSKGANWAATVSVNHRKGKWNIYGDYSFLRTQLFQNLISYRQILYQTRITENTISNLRDGVQQNHSIRAGMDFQVNKKTVVGGLVSGFNNRWMMIADTRSNYIVNNTPDTTANIFTDELNQWQHYMANFYLQHSITKSQKINFDIDYLFYNNNNPIHYLNTYYDGSDNFVYEQGAKSGKRTPIRVYVGKLDYIRNLGKRIDLESGLKITLSRFKNDVKVFKSFQSDWVLDDDFSAKYMLKENIAAAYGTLNINVNKKTNVKLGLRYEYTTSNLGTGKQSDIVDRKYGNLFPSFFLAHKVNDVYGINFSYSRRITRPTFNELAPWVIFIDPYTFMSGNPAIQPSTANALKADLVFKKNMLSLAYTYEDNFIVRFLPTVDASTNKQVITSRNLNGRQTIAIILTIPLKLTEWWTMQYTAVAAWNRQSAVFNSDPVAIEAKNLRITGSQNFTLPSNYSLELSGFYQSAGLMGFSIFKPFGSLNFSAQKKLKKTYGSFRFSVIDLFNTNRIRNSVNFPQQNLVLRRDFRFVYRTINLTYTKGFGSSGIKERKSRLTGSDEERKRVE